MKQNRTPRIIFGGLGKHLGFLCREKVGKGSEREKGREAKGTEKESKGPEVGSGGKGALKGGATPLWHQYVPFALGHAWTLQKRKIHVCVNQFFAD